MPDPTSATPEQRPSGATSAGPAPLPQAAFAELARVTLADHSVATLMELVSTLTERTVPGAAAVSVTLVEHDEPTTLASSSPLALQLDERQYAHGYGPCLHAARTAEIVHVPDLGADDRWPDYAAEAVRAGARSSVSVPIPLQRDVAAALNVYATEVDAFDEASRELATAFAAYAGVALANMHVYEAQTRTARQLQEAMTSRAVIEQAKGIVMGQRRCTADEAFEFLAGISQHTNRKLRDVAQALVDATMRGDGPG